MEEHNKEVRLKGQSQAKVKVSQLKVSHARYARKQGTQVKHVGLRIKMMVLGNALGVAARITW